MPTKSKTSSPKPARPAAVADVSEPLGHLAQATAGALAVLPVAQIHPHPKNIRHNAVADTELVESIRAQGLLQPLVVAPIGGTELGPDDPGPAYRLIAGHRRLDGVKRAGGDHATVIIRRDLTSEADQVAAMLVENGRRADLTPLEEAEGYGQLRFDFGWKPGQIAKAAGHTVETVNKRLRLLKLDKPAQTKLDKGQLTIEDAIAISDLPKAEQTRVAKSAGTGSFKWDLAQARDRVKKKAATDKLVAKLTADGIPQLRIPATTSLWGLNHADHGMTKLSQTFSADPNAHAGCLAFVLNEEWGGKGVEYVCTDVPAHDEQLDEKRRAERLEAERRDKEERERDEALRLARRLRLDAGVDAIKPGVKIPPVVVDIVTAFLPALIADLDADAAVWYFDAVDLPEADRWSSRSYAWKTTDLEKLDRHITQVLNAPAHGLLRTLVLVLGLRHVEAHVITRLDTGMGRRSSEAFRRRQADDALSWLRFLANHGHDLTDIDREIQAAAAGDDQSDGAVS